MPNRIESLAIRDVKIITPARHNDARGSFCETFNQRALKSAGINTNFVQDNSAVSILPGTVRGLHFQASPYAQGKLLRVIRGRIFDVAVDLRFDSATFGQWVGKEISADSAEQIWIPAGFAHGYCTLEPFTEVFYKVDEYYKPAAEGGILWDDPDLDIHWPEVRAEPIVSKKDRELPEFAQWAATAVDILDSHRTLYYDHLNHTRHSALHLNRVAK